VWHRPPTVTSFDPEGDQQENPDATSLAVDRDPTTAWTTDTYRNDPHLGGLKSGVGLLLDLGRPRQVQVADLVLSAAGADVEIRAGDQAPTQASDLPTVAQRSDARSSLRLTLSHPVTARYWLVWFTKLPPDAGGFRVGVAEVALLG
jgi:putative peptidoglycan lipid II flippase